MLTDTHCHLDLHHFDSDREAVIARAREVGVGRILIPGLDLAQSRRALMLAEQYPELRVAVGVHPNEAQHFGEAELDELRELARHPKVDAIGEIGIDLYWKTMPLEQQQRAFRAQLQVATELNKPVIIHDRDAHEDVLTVLREAAPSAGVVLHSFSGDMAMAHEAVALGCYLGVDGPVTYKKNDGLRAIFAAVPLDRILIETDAPYLTPQKKRGARNEPAYVRWVAEQLAEVRGLTLTEIAGATTENALRFFRWPESKLEF